MIRKTFLSSAGYNLSSDNIILSNSFSMTDTFFFFTQKGFKLYSKQILTVRFCFELFFFATYCAYFLTLQAHVQIHQLFGIWASSCCPLLRASAVWMAVCPRGHNRWKSLQFTVCIFLKFLTFSWLWKKCLHNSCERFVTMVILRVQRKIAIFLTKVKLNK